MKYTQKVGDDYVTYDFDRGYDVPWWKLLLMFICISSILPIFFGGMWLLGFLLN